jgi:voltage-gated potassium channel Kch
MDFALSAVLFFDFGLRLVWAPRKAHYFFARGGWLDLIGSIPALAIFRLVRMVRTARQLGHVGEHTILREFKKARADGALFVIVWLVIVVLEFASASVLFFEEKASGAHIKTASDALWWSFQTITTVGYGDVYPITQAGRGVGYVLMVVGVGLFGTFTAWLANWFFGPKAQAEAASLVTGTKGAEETLPPRK